MHSSRPLGRIPPTLLGGRTLFISVALLALLTTSRVAYADCPAAPLTSQNDMIVSFLAAQGGTQAAPSTLFASTVEEGMLVYDGAAKALKLCNGTSWITLQSTSGAGAAAGSLAGAVQFRGAGGNLAADDANFVWDDTSNRLGIGTATPATPLHISMAA